MVTALTKTRATEIDALFDRANTHPTFSYWGPWRYVQGKFWSASESEMLRYAPYKDNGERPGCICCRSDTNEALQLTGTDRTSAASWTKVSWIYIRTKPATPTLGDVFFNPTLSPDPVGEIYLRSPESPYNARWTEFRSSKYQLDKLRSRAFWREYYKRVDTAGVSLFPLNRNEWHSDHRYIIYNVGGRVAGTAAQINISENRDVSLFTATTGNDPKVRLAWLTGVWPFTVVREKPNLNQKARASFFIKDTDGGTEVSFRGRIIVLVTKPFNLDPPTVTFRMEPDGVSLNVPLQFRSGYTYNHVLDIDLHNISTGAHHFWVDATVDFSDETLDQAFLTDTDVMAFQGAEFYWDSAEADRDSTADGLHPTTEITEVRATPTFNSAQIFTIGYPLVEGSDPLYYYNEPSLRIEYDAGGGFVGTPVLVAKCPPIYGNEFSEVFYIDDRPTTTFTGYAYCDHASGAIGNRYALTNFPDDFGKTTPVPMPTNVVSYAVTADGNVRSLARHWKYADAKLNSQFGNSDRIFTPTAQFPKQLNRTFPNTVWAVVPHRVGKRDPSHVSRSDPAIEPSIGNQKNGTFNSLIVLPVEEGEPTGDPYYPDWVNFDNQALFYRDRLAAAPDYTGEINAEVITHNPSPTMALTAASISGNESMNWQSGHFTAEMYNQTWNHLGEIGLLTWNQVKAIIGLP